MAVGLAIQNFSRNDSVRMHMCLHCCAEAPSDFVTSFDDEQRRKVLRGTDFFQSRRRSIPRVQGKTYKSHKTTCGRRIGHILGRLKILKRAATCVRSTAVLKGGDSTELMPKKLLAEVEIFSRLREPLTTFFFDLYRNAGVTREGKTLFRTHQYTC